MVNKKKKGFTLIEMMIVIAVIAILVSIIIPVVGNSTIKANAATNAANLRSVEGQVTYGRLLGDIVIDNLTDAYTYYPNNETLDFWGGIAAPNCEECIVVEKDEPMWVQVHPDGSVVPTYRGYTAEYFAYIAENGEPPEGFVMDSTSKLLNDTMATFDKMHKEYDELGKSPLGGFVTSGLDAAAGLLGYDGVHGFLDEVEQQTMINNGQIPNEYADLYYQIQDALGGGGNQGGGSTPEPEVTVPEETEPSGGGGFC